MVDGAGRVFLYSGPVFWGFDLLLRMFEVIIVV